MRSPAGWLIAAILMLVLLALLGLVHLHDL